MSFEEKIKKHPFYFLISIVLSTALIIGGATYTITIAIISDENKSLSNQVDYCRENSEKIERKLNELVNEKEKISKDNEKNIENLRNCSIHEQELSKIKTKHDNLYIENQKLIKHNEKNIEIIKTYMENNSQLKAKVSKLESDNEILLNNLSTLTNIDREIEKLEQRELQYEQCPSFFYPVSEEYKEKCKEGLKMVREELSKLREKLQY